jgi:transposase-like protein
MPSISYARHQYPPSVIQHSVWLYLRFTLSYRDVEELVSERGLDVSYETIRRWVLKFAASPGASFSNEACPFTDSRDSSRLSACSNGCPGAST